MSQAPPDMLDLIVTRWILFTTAMISMLALATPTAATAADGKKSKKVQPIRQLDRTRAVGAPVLDDQSRPGLYVWIEDGAFRLAAVPRDAKTPKKNRPPPALYAAKVTSTQKISTKEIGDFRAAGAGKSIKVSTRVSTVIAKGAFETDGDITIALAPGSDTRLKLFIGPLAKRGASSVKIGRF